MNLVKNIDRQVYYVVAFPTNDILFSFDALRPISDQEFSDLYEIAKLNGKDSNYIPDNLSKFKNDRLVHI